MLVNSSTIYIHGQRYYIFFKLKTVKIAFIKKHHISIQIWKPDQQNTTCSIKKTICNFFSLQPGYNYKFGWKFNYVHNLVNEWLQSGTFEIFFKSLYHCTCLRALLENKLTYNIPIENKRCSPTWTASIYSRVMTPSM